VIIPVSKEIDIQQLFYKNDISVPAKAYRSLNLGGKIRLAVILRKANRKINHFHEKTLEGKECYIGPFWGEFGNFLLHFLPYVSFLHKNGVKVNICSLENYLPLMIDDNGNNIYNQCVPLRMFFKEVYPQANKVTPPADVQKMYDEFKKTAEESGKPFLDLTDDMFYWYVYKNWQLKGRQYIYPLEKVVKDNNVTGNNVTLFPRRRSTAYTPNNGEPIDYMKLAEAIAPYFDNVFITGHPAMSAEVYEKGNIKVKLSENNIDVLKCCANSSLIVTQHSGAMHLGNYVNVPVALIFKGKLPVKGLDDSMRFRENIGRRNIYVALNEEQLISFVKDKKYL